MEKTRNKNEFTPVVITPPSSLEMPDFKELWDYRGLFYLMIRRDIMLRFQQTQIGFLWVVLQPLILMVIFYILFGVFVKIPTDNIPYSLFFLSGFVVWQFFSQIVNNSSMSLVANIGVIIKSYFPRLVLPLSTIPNAFVDFVICFLVFLAFMILNASFSITLRYLLLAPLIIIVMAFASGVGMLFGASMVVFRESVDMKDSLV